MKKPKIKYWTAKEIAVLRKNAKLYPTAAEAIRKTSEKIDRTYEAVSFKYYCWLKNGEKTVSPSSVTNKKKALHNRVPIVTYYNGTTKKTEVIINTPDVLVAKVDDIVITIQY